MPGPPTATSDREEGGSGPFRDVDFASGPLAASGFSLLLPRLLMFWAVVHSFESHSQLMILRGFAAWGLERSITDLNIRLLLRFLARTCARHAAALTLGIRASR